jgi:hypothetical protein
VDGEKFFEVITKNVLHDLAYIKRFKIKCEFFGAGGRSWHRLLLIYKVTGPGKRPGGFTRWLDYGGSCRQHRRARAWLRV